MTSRATLWVIAACAAIAIPVLLAPNLPPTATFPNQAMALFGWGVLLALLAGATPVRAVYWPSGLKTLLAALALLLAAALAPPWWAGQPLSLALPAAAMIAAAAFTAVVGAAVQQTGSSAAAFRAICIALLVGATLNACIAIVQVYAPTWADGLWIAQRVIEGRAVGNLRQSNHLCTVLLWGIVAVIWLGETRVLRRTIVEPAAVLLMFGVVLSASRAGAAGAVMLAVWGLLDRRLTGRTRLTLLLAPLAYALSWAGAAAWAEHSHQVLVGGARLATTDNMASSRFGAWANTLVLIQMHPWLGVGFGEFNFAWSMSEFPGRPTPFFDHTHNLILQFVVELGVPLALLVVGLLGWAFWCAARNCWAAIGTADSGSSVRPAFAMLALVLMHSMLEYPLWYAYFLLPTAFAFGLCLGRSNPVNVASGQSANVAKSAPALRPLALLLTLGAAFSVLDYFRVVPIFLPLNHFTPLSERFDTGRGSVLFAHHAEYAVATNVDPSDVGLKAAQRAAHNLLDSRLMMAWANALHATGDVERAKYVAQRLKEFRNPASEPFFAPCHDPKIVEPLRPFQCFAPQRKFTFEDFR